MERLRTSRLSPIPTASNVFPTVLEEPVTPSEIDDDNPDPRARVGSSILGSSPTANGAGADPNPGSSQNQQTGHLFRKHRRRLPLVQPCNISKNRSSRSFDSGISCLLQSSAGAGNAVAAGTSGTGLPVDPGSPGPIASDPGYNPGSPNHISCSRQSYMSSSPCNSPGPRSPRVLPDTNRLHGTPTSMLASSSAGPVGGGPGFFGPSFNSRRFSEQVESYSTSKGSSEDSDSSPPTEPSPPPLNGGSSGGHSPPPPTSPILRVSRRMLPETPKTPYNVWQQSRDSLDSGVYSRSTTCDSYPGRKSGSPILSSTSPPTLARHSWRRAGVARLPEPPISSTMTGDGPPATAPSATPPIIPATSAGSTYVENSGCGSQIEDSSKRVHFEPNQNCNQQNPAPAGSASPSTKSRMGLLASLKNSYNSKIMESQSSPVKSSAGILTKLHEKLAGTRSLGSNTPNTVQNNLYNACGQNNLQLNQQHNQHNTLILNSNSANSSQNYNNALSNLDVPKLRDLKSHSFPPPFSNSSSNMSQKTCQTATTVTSGYCVSVCHPAVGGSSASVSASSTGGETNTSSFADAPINSLTDSSNSPTSQDFETTDDRRKRWQLLHDHSSAAFIATR